jgi:hypothetical protein
MPQNLSLAQRYSVTAWTVNITSATGKISFAMALLHAGSRLRTSLMEDGGVASLVASADSAREAAARLGGAEEQSAFA